MREPGNDEIVSAQVIIMRNRNRTDIPAAESAVVERVRTAFREFGFEVGEVFGVSFSITATVEVFEQVFQTKLLRNDRGGMIASSSGTELLPLPRLNAALIAHIEAVTFTQPPDFGPSNFC